MYTLTKAIHFSPELLFSKIFIPFHSTFYRLSFINIRVFLSAMCDIARLYHLGSGLEIVECEIVNFISYPFILITKIARI